MVASKNPERNGLSLRGAAGLMIAAGLVVLVSVWVPAYRLFLLFSILIGVVIAIGLFLWHRFRPLKEEDLNHKRPLGLG